MPPPARPPDREEGHVIIRVPSRQSYRRSRSRPRPADAADAHRNSENDEDDARSAASSISALSMGTARPHRATGNSTNVNSNRAGSTRAAAVGAVIGADRLEIGGSRSFATSVATSEQRVMAVGDPAQYRSEIQEATPPDLYFGGLTCRSGGHPA